VLGDRPVELALALPQQAERADSSRYPLSPISYRNGISNRCAWRIRIMSTNRPYVIDL
jgi:hypothetical protein